MIEQDDEPVMPERHVAIYQDLDRQQLLYLCAKRGFDMAEMVDLDEERLADQLAHSDRTQGRESGQENETIAQYLASDMGREDFGAASDR